MKQTLLAALAAALLPLRAAAASAADPIGTIRWPAETSRPVPYQATTVRGSTVALEARLLSDGRPVALPADAEASFFWQTNGMGGLYWQAPAAAGANGSIRAVWAPEMDAGADQYRFFLRALTAGGADYSAHGGLRLLPGPGAVPNALPLPVRVLDFAAVAVTNAAWATPEDVALAVAAAEPGNYAAVSNAAMTALQSESDPTVPAWAKAPERPAYTASDVGAATVADATLTPVYSQTPTFSEWIVVKTPQGIDLDEVGVSFEVPYQTEDEEQWCFVFFGMNEGSGNTDPLATSLSNNAFSATRTRTDIIGYQLGSQEDKPLAAASHTHPATDITGLPPAPDYSESNAALAATIQAVAPAPGDYAAVSNRAMSAISSLAPATNYTDAAVAGVVADAERASVAGVTNFVAEAVAQLGAGDSAAELHRLILADLWRRVDALEGSDGSGYVTAADAEALWADRLAAVSTNVFWYLRNAAAAGAELFQSQLALVQPRAPTGFSETRFNSSRGISIPLDPTTARAYAATAGGSRLSITSFSAATLNPAWIRLSGWSDVVWPGGIVRTGLDYDPARVCVFRIQQIGSAVIVEGVAQQ